MQQRHWLGALVLANLAAGLYCAVLGAVFLIWPTPEIVLDGAGLLRAIIPVLMPLLIVHSRAFSGALLVLLAGALFAAALGLWRRDPASRRLESGLLWGAVVVFSGGGGMSVLMRNTGGWLWLMLAVAAGRALWWLHQGETRQCFGETAESASPTRLAAVLAAGLAIGVLGFGWVLTTVLKALQGLR